MVTLGDAIPLNPDGVKLFTNFPVSSSCHHPGILNQDSTSNSCIALEEGTQGYGHLYTLGTPTRALDCIPPVRGDFHLLPSLGRCGPILP